MKNKPTFILTVSCPGRSGIVAAIGNFLADRACFIKELHQYDDLDFGRFFCTIEFFFEGAQKPHADQLRAAFEMTAMGFNMEWAIHDTAEPTKVLIMVSKYDHCLRDLLYRRSTGELNIDITAIVSNHEDLRKLADQEGVPYIHLPMTRENKPEQEARLLALVEETGTELVVLARYMQILSPEFVKKYPHKIINIHHSFLPAFVGSNPYKQAFHRGVKIIGATSHFVTEELDDGQIIAQDIIRISHKDTIKDLIRKGRDLERFVLARALHSHFEHRVLVNGKKTIIFE